MGKLNGSKLSEADNKAKKPAILRKGIGENIGATVLKSGIQPSQVERVSWDRSIKDGSVLEI